MATLNEIAQNLAKSIITSSDKQKAARDIAEYINGLVYSGSKDKLSYTSKLQIVEWIKEYLSGERRFTYENGGKLLIVEGRNNKEFLELIDYILTQLNN